MSQYDRVSTPQKNDNSGLNQSKKVPLQRSSHSVNIIQRMRMYPQTFSTADARVLQRTIGNRAVCQLMKEIGLLNSKPVQREPLQEEEEEILQGKFNTIQREEVPKKEEEERIQMKRKNKTGLPDYLKGGVEDLSGLSMDDVNVHYNSYKPAQVGALAYTQGTDIYVAPGQEKHLPHEAWHVVQQAQGRVRPTMQLMGMSVNDDEGLEREADDMGRRAAKSDLLGRNMCSNLSKALHKSVAPIQRETVLNYGSGTDVQTLIRPIRSDDYVLNIDSGHMILSDIIEEFLLQEKYDALLGIMKELLDAYAKGHKGQSSKELLTSSAKQKDLFWLKHEFFSKYPGYAGVQNILKRIGRDASDRFEKEKERLNNGTNFEYGDSSTGLRGFNKDVDRIYCINGYQYSPLTQDEIFVPMANALKTGGTLHLVSSILGDTVRDFYQDYKRAHKKIIDGFISSGVRRNLNEVLSKIGLKPAMQLPIFKYFVYNAEQSFVYLTKTNAFRADDYTKGLKSFSTEAHEELPDNLIHVTLVLTRNDVKVNSIN
ncbi:MAG: DUF4157 domain-containing protein [Bacillota bacterium]